MRGVDDVCCLPLMSRNTDKAFIQIRGMLSSQLHHYCNGIFMLMWSMRPF